MSNKLAWKGWRGGEKDLLTPQEKIKNIRDSLQPFLRAVKEKHFSRAIIQIQDIIIPQTEEYLAGAGGTEKINFEKGLIKLEEGKEIEELKKQIDYFKSIFGGKDGEIDRVIVEIEIAIGRAKIEPLLLQ